MLPKAPATGGVPVERAIISLFVMVLTREVSLGRSNMMQLRQAKNSSVAANKPSLRPFVTARINNWSEAVLVTVIQVKTRMQQVSAGLDNGNN